MFVNVNYLLKLNHSILWPLARCFLRDIYYSFFQILSSIYKNKNQNFKPLVFIFIVKNEKKVMYNVADFFFIRIVFMIFPLGCKHRIQYCTIPFYFPLLLFSKYLFIYFVKLFPICFIWIRTFKKCIIFCIKDFFFTLLLTSIKFCLIWI